MTSTFPALPTHGSNARTAPECPDSGIPAGSIPPDPSGRSPGALSSLSIVLSCFNEQENVADAIRYALSAAERCATDYEVIVVDDGSTDETARIAAGFVEGDRHVRLRVHAYNRGYGDAVRSGVEAAGMDWVLLTDADLQFDLRELEDFLPSAARADLVVGWRILRQDPVNRRLNAAAWNWLVRRMFHLPVRDVDCAFKLVRRDLLQSCALTSGGAMISTELLVKCLAAGVLADYGHATGVDLSPLAVEAARHRGHPDVRRGAIEDLPFADDSFDAVTCLDVIEHTADDRASLAELRRVTRPGGLALVTVPAYQSLWSAHDEVNLHFRRYGRGQLEAAAEATGWSWVRGTHFNAMLLAPAAVVRRATRGRARGTQRSDLDLTPAFADRLLELPMAAEARWLRGGRRLACGLSMLAVLRCPVVAPASAPRRGAPLTRRSSTHRHLTTAA